MYTGRSVGKFAAITSGASSVSVYRVDKIVCLIFGSSETRAYAMRMNEYMLSTDIIL